MTNIMGIVAATKHLDKGYYIDACPNSYQDHCEAVYKDLVVGLVHKVDYESIKIYPDYEELLVLLPGYSVGYILCKKDQEQYKKYEVNVSYKNRPNDPIEF